MTIVSQQAEERSHEAVVPVYNCLWIKPVSEDGCLGGINSEAAGVPSCWMIYCCQYGFHCSSNQWLSSQQIRRSAANGNTLIKPSLSMLSIWITSQKSTMAIYISSQWTGKIENLISGSNTVPHSGPLHQILRVIRVCHSFSKTAQYTFVSRSVTGTIIHLFLFSKSQVTLKILI